MTSRLTRSQQSDIPEKILPVLAASPSRRLRSIFCRGDLRAAGERSQKRATEARASIGVEKARAARRLRALTGEERNSSRPHCARDGHRFESPQLLGANRPGFPAPTIPRLFSALARKLMVCGVYSAVMTGLGRRTRK
jgi:hypothetical protein